jgi:hypothetical protein
MTNTDKISLMNEAAGFLARVWKRIGAPVSYEHVTSVDGVKVRVIVDYDEGEMKDAAKPKRRVGDREIESERSQDA